MNAEIREIVGNIRTILAHCVDVGSGFSILLGFRKHIDM
jgi:hypothetical protein